MNHVHSDRSTDRWDMQKSIIDQQVNTEDSGRLYCPTRLKSKWKYKGL